MRMPMQNLEPHPPIPMSRRRAAVDENIGRVANPPCSPTVFRAVPHAARDATGHENAGGSVGDRPQQVIFRAVRNYRNEFEKTIADKLQADGVAAFAKSFETLLASVAAKQEKLLADKQALTASLEPTHR